ncbi:MAG: hypothetical protein ACREL6_12865, partial [Gemmatimonadales bacterium]
ALKESGVRVILVAEGSGEPVRIPIRDSLGTLLEYKLDQNGEPVETMMQEEALHRIAEAAEGSVVGAGVPDQAGAIRQLTSAFKRAPMRAVQSSDLRPLAWIPILAGVLLLMGHTVTRRGASLVVLAGVLIPGARAAAQLPSPAERALRNERPAVAASRYLEGIGSGPASATAWYNAGTAALAAGNLDVARRALTEAGKSVDPLIRYRALYNLGVIDLLAARDDTANAATWLEDARRNLQEALLLQPESERAKWNLELALREEPPDPSGGGGGQTPPNDGGGGGGTPPPPADASPSSLSQQEAEQILNSVEREERQTRARKAQANRVSAGGGVKDW